MKHIRMMAMIAGCCALVMPCAVRAEDDKPADKSSAQPSREELREKLKDMSPEERRKYLQEHRPANGPGNGDPSQRREEFAKRLGLDPAEMEKLSPQERQAKMKEAVEKKIADLEKQKADGTISEQDGRILERLKQMSKIGSREDIAKSLGLKPEEMKNLSPKERQAKFKEALDAKID